MSDKQVHSSDQLLSFYIRERYTDLPSVFFRALVEAIGLGVVAIDQHKFICYANHAAHELFGYQAGEMLGLSIHCLLPQELREKHNDHLNKFFTNPHARVMNGGQVVQAITKDGRRVSVRVALDAFEYGQSKNYAAVITPVKEQ